MISVVMAPILLHAASQELSLSTDASWPACRRCLRPTNHLVPQCSAIFVATVILTVQPRGFLGER